MIRDTSDVLRFTIETIIISISVVSEVASKLSVNERVLKYFLWYSIEI